MALSGTTAENSHFPARNSCTLSGRRTMPDTIPDAKSTTRALPQKVVVFNESMTAQDAADRAPPGGDIDSESTAASGRKDPLLGALVAGKFRVLHAIARGGMGRIYYAMQEGLNRPVALKVVQGDGNFEKDSQFLKRFQEEASILAKLQHPNVVTIFDYGRIEDSPLEQYFIAMEYLAGETLTQRLVDREFLDLRDCLVIGRQMLRGLREAHVHSIVHRDLKPPNVLLVPEADGGEIVKIVDFGIGKVLKAEGSKAEDLTQDGFMVGTPRFMAPEQFEGTASPASDLYALGTIMYLCATGKLPFAGGNPAELMVAKLARPYEPLLSAKPDLEMPLSFEALIDKLLARSPDDRPSHDELAVLFAAVEDDVFGTSQSTRRNYYAPRKDATPVPADRSSSPSGIKPKLKVDDTLLAPGLVSASLLSNPPPVITSAPPPSTGVNLPSVAPPPSFATPRQTSQRRGPLIGAIALAALFAASGVVWFVALRPKPLAIQSVALSASAPPSAPAPEPTTFTLLIESTPPQARVFEGNAFVGMTPFSVSIDRARAATEPRIFVLKKEGFADFTVVQGSSNNDPVRSVTLAPEAPNPVKSAPAVIKPPPAASAKPPPPASDIRTKR